MMASIKVPTPLRVYTDGEKEFSMQGSTVREVMEGLTREFPEITAHIYTEEGMLRAYVNLFLNDENIRDLEGLSTVVREHDRLMIVPSIAGGTSFDE